MRFEFETAGRFKDKPVEFWEDFLVTDEKIWTTNGMINPQNDLVRAEAAEEVPPINLEKFPGQRMSWLGVSPTGHTGIKWMTGTVNGKNYQENILKKVVLDDVLQRKGSDKPIHKRKLFRSNARMVFEQDFATPHSTYSNQEFMEQNFPSHTLTLHRYRDKDPLFFWSKVGQFLVYRANMAYFSSRCLS